MRLWDKKGYSFDLEFSVDRYLDGKLSGFTLQSNGESVANIFCSVFPDSLEKGVGKIKIGDNGIWLSNNTYNIYIPLKEYNYRNFRDFCEVNGKFRINSNNDPPKFNILLSYE